MCAIIFLENVFMPYANFAKHCLCITTDHLRFCTVVLSITCLSY